MRIEEVTTRIVFNGKEYASVEDMPADVRRLYDEALRQAGPLLGCTSRTSTRIIFNGREYRSADELPAGVRPLYDQVMAGVRAGHPPSPSLDPRFSATPFEPGVGSLAGRPLARVVKACAWALALWILLRIVR